MDLHVFDESFLNKLLQKASTEQKSVYLLGDLNVNLINYNNHTLTNEFPDSLESHFL